MESNSREGEQMMSEEEIAVQTAARRRSVAPVAAEALIEELKAMGYSLTKDQNIPISACGAADCSRELRIDLGGK
jgi:hypothetical protein